MFRGLLDWHRRIDLFGSFNGAGCNDRLRANKYMPRRIIECLSKAARIAPHTNTNNLVVGPQYEVRIIEASDPAEIIVQAGWPRGEL